MQSTPVFSPAPALPVVRIPRVLLIEPEDAHAMKIADRLTGDDVDVLLAGSPQAAASRLRTGPVDAVIVRGSMLVVQRLRAAGLLEAVCPVIALCDGGAEDRTRALARGAVDALTLPVDGPELSERLRLALTRGEVAAPDRMVIEVAGGLRIIPASNEVEIRGQRLEVSRKEFELLRVLASDPERVFTKAQLLREIWGHQQTGTTRTLDSHACRLRLKLAECGGNYVLNKWGVGYRLLPPS